MKKRKIFPVMIALALSAQCIVTGVNADTMSDLEAKQAKLENELSDVESELSKYEDLAEEAENYLEEYDAKMKLQEERVSVVEEQIELCNEEIAGLETDIAAKELDLEDGITQFKQRLRALYMAGNDSMASVLAGSNDFYDMLARMEFVERISRHDNELIDLLNVQIAELDTSKAEYQDKLNTLESKKAEEELYYAELRDTYNNHAETKAAREAMVADYQERADEIQAEQDRVEQELQEEIRRLQEEAERKRQEEERKRKEEEERLKKLAQENNTEYVPPENTTPAGYSETGFIWPVPSVRNMSDGYGERWIVETQSSDFHKGIDITKPGCAGEPVVASAAGTVIQAGNKYNGYGECVIIDHGNGISTLYAHNSSVAVSVGDTVSQGQVIAYIGHTGQAFGDHCHFEVRVNGQHTNPLNYVSMNN